MTALTHTTIDAATMLRRQLKHQLRYPSITVMLVAMPVVFLLLFVYVFGGTLGAGIEAGMGRVSGGRAEYLAYVTPGILVIAMASVAQGTSISVAMDMTEGIVARFRTMAIARAAVLTGHVGAAVLQTYLAVAVVVGVAVAIGLRPTADVAEWLALVGVVGLIALALTWVTVALGIRSKTVEGASNVPMPLLLLPFLGSGFVPTESMPIPMRWFAEHQPFTPFIETIRGLLLGTPVGRAAAETVAWCAALTLVSYLAARSSYERMSVRVG